MIGIIGGSGVYNNDMLENAKENDMESLKYLISEWLESDLPFLVERGIGTGKIPPDVGFVITGVRRSGKTYLIYEIAQKLRREIPHQNIIYINFEDDRLYPLKGDELRKLPIQRISSGKITHSAKWLDFSLEVENVE